MSKRLRFLPTAVAATLVVALFGCSTPDATSLVFSAGAAASAKLGPILEGAALVPSGLIANNSAGIIAGNSSRYGLFALGDEVPLAESLVYLTDPLDNFFKVGGKMISTTTDKLGAYRLASNVPKGVPVVVNAILDGNRRMTGFTVPADGTQRVDMSVASNFVTEYLRLHAHADGRSMGDYDLKQLPGLADVTRQALTGNRLALPDLVIGHIPDMNRAYGLAVGTNGLNLGDLWAKLLGHRVIAALTVAGTGNAAGGGDGKAATAADLYRPRQAVEDAAGNLYIADEGNNRVRRVDAVTGLMSSVAGTGTGGFSGDGGLATKAELRDPRTIALDAAGNLYIGDQTNARVRKVDAKTGVITTIVGNPDADGAGGWVGGFAGADGPATQAKIFAPRGLVVDAQGNLYVCDSEHDTPYHVIWKVDAASHTISVFAGTPNHVGAFAGDGGPANKASLNYPNQIALDPQGRLLIADAYNHCIRRIDPATNVITTIAGVGGQEGTDPDGKPANQTRLSKPYGIAVAPDGRLFISEQGRGVIRTVSPDGLMHTLAGGGSDVRDGEALMLTLTQPHDLWVESNGNLIVADTRGSRVRRVLTQFGY